MEHHFICEQCGKPFVAKRSDARYCSHTCKQRVFDEKRRQQRRQTHEQEQNSSFNLSPFQMKTTIQLVAYREMLKEKDLNTSQLRFIADNLMAIAESLNEKT